MPVIQSPQTQDISETNGNGQIDHYIITSDADVDDSTFPDYIDSNTIGNSTGTWSVSGYGNIQIDATELTENDGARPVIISAIGYAGSNLLTITFSEPVNNSVYISDLTYNSDGNEATAITGMNESNGLDKIITATPNNAITADDSTDTLAATFSIHCNAAPSNNALTNTKSISVSEYFEFLKPDGCVS